MKPESKIISVYCDESCHLNKDDSDVMSLGAVYCPRENVKQITLHLRELKKKYAFKRHFETKWSKASPSKQAYFKELVDYFFSESLLNFRGIIIPDKKKLDHLRFKQTHDDWYYKMYYTLLSYIIHPHYTYHFYLDLKDTQGGSKTRTLQAYLAHRIGDDNHTCVAKVQQMRSHESELLQLCDVLTGALAYSQRTHTFSNAAKKHVIESIHLNMSHLNLQENRHYHLNKFNILMWEAR